MKKLLLVFSALALVLSSCSKSDSAPVAQEDPAVLATNVLLKKIITSQGTTVVNTATNVYNGNKLVEIVGTNGDKAIYTYTGDLITKIEEYTGTTLNNIETLTYDTSQKLASYVKIDYDTFSGTPSGYRVVYTYDGSGNIIYSAFNGSATLQNTPASSGKATITNGNITTIIKNYLAVPQVSSAYTQTQTITYDDKINPGNNITGFYKVTLQGTDIGLAGSIHNILNVTTNNGTYNTSIDESNYTYNTNNYPATEVNISKSFNSSGIVTFSSSFSNQYTY